MKAAYQINVYRIVDKPICTLLPCQGMKKRKNGDTVIGLTCVTVCGWTLPASHTLYSSIGVTPLISLTDCVAVLPVVTFLASHSKHQSNSHPPTLPCDLHRSTVTLERLPCVVNKYEIQIVIIWTRIIIHCFDV